MNTPDLQVLRDVAEKATGNDPWSASQQQGTPRHCVLAQVWGANGDSLADLDPTEDPSVASAIAEFIATFDPPTVLQLLASLQSYEEALGEVLAALDASRGKGAYPDFEAWETKARALLSKAESPS